MASGLLIIDIQNDYFEGGSFPLGAPDEAVRHASEVLDRFRAAGHPVVHVQHVWDAPDAAFFAPGTRGVEIHEFVAPLDSEPVVTKAHPNSFLETELTDVLGRLDVDHLVVAGMQSNLCVDATVRAAADLGFTVTVVADACAAADLQHGDRPVGSADVHAAFMAALDGNYATVVDAAALEV